MNIIKTPIIPPRQQFAKVEAPHELDKKAICIFAATGFFLDTDTYFQNQKVLPPASENSMDENGMLLKSTPWFKWHYSPRNISFETALDEFTQLFETIVAEQANNRPVILPLSGGLDSRTQAVALHEQKAEVHSYSYSFAGGFKEHHISAQIAKTCNFRFQPFIIPPNYLWQVIDELANINGCYSEFTHPRQMAVLDDFKKMQGSFSLGHWGDVLFDRGVGKKEAHLPELEILYKKIIKKGGLALANKLWIQWGLEGSFEAYLKERLEALLNQIDIDHKGAKVRAFKSLYWAPRWTSVNLSVFEEAHPIHLPYYDNRMCAFICTLPEEYLADRKLQIAYIKQRSPKLAKIMWQAQKPYNLNNYHKNKAPGNLPYRISNKLQREGNALLGKKYIQRNWELQFLGMENDEQLQSYIFNPQFHSFVPKSVVTEFYNAFKTQDPVTYSHPVSMLLTLSVWYANNRP
ncbi:asparagine synthase-related protein [Marixanthomonas spongiae]|uniref:asparagine synthase (glutamine-hydrolyzing) n=1 Tax=Marixanthomonas spongiae TaxID=2174845 RepID=A0A2U0I5X4_9FLAO|nr:asparagine synthase-related protein [Marixanthomonas spongiae]PVW16464.1 asparagine synthase [Marixanthomonas spongiae]